MTETVVIRTSEIPDRMRATVPTGIARRHVTAFHREESFRDPIRRIRFVRTEVPSGAAREKPFHPVRQPEFVRVIPTHVLRKEEDLLIRGRAVPGAV